MERQFVGAMEEVWVSSTTSQTFMGSRKRGTTFTNVAKVTPGSTSQPKAIAKLSLGVARVREHLLPTGIGEGLEW